MDYLSSSFVSTIFQPKVVPRHSSSLPQIYMSSIESENKPPKATQSSPQPTSPNKKVLESSSTLSHDTKNPQPKNTLVQQKLVSIKMYEKQASLLKPSLLLTFLNAIDDIINTLIDPPMQPSIDPRLVLSGNFAPVEELSPTTCEIEVGVLPSCLDGAYIRSGPNPQFHPRGPYHLFDGDGMLHSIRISDGKAIFCSRYVKTYKYKIEHEVGSNIFPNLFSGFNSRIGFVTRGLVAVARVIIGQFNPSYGIGSANTSLSFFGNKLYALSESDLPYEVKVTLNGDIETLCRNDFNGKLLTRMTAHPKVDPTTGETFAFRTGLIPPFLTYFRFDSKGNKQVDVPIFSMLSPTFLHDCAITKKYVIFPENQIEMNLAKMIFWGQSFTSFDPKKVSRIGVIPRYDKDEKNMKWFAVPGLNALHAINAWDEVDKDGNEVVVMVAPNIISAEHTLERTHLIYSLIEMVRIELDTGVVIRQPMSARNLEWAVINPTYVGRKNRYIYAAIGGPFPKLVGLVKLDVSLVEDRRDCIVASRMFGPGCYGSEPCFVATHPDDENADEDEGYVVSYVHDENTQESRFLVMDAKSSNLDVIASVKLPQRVPYGFHGLFVRDKDLEPQE